MKRIAMACTLAACGGSTQPKTTPPGPEEVGTAETVAHAKEEAPRDLKAGTSWENWPSFTNVSPGPWISGTHGKRFVEIYVNDIALEAYKTGGELPVGSIVVKPSWENEAGKPGAEGPLFVMEKKAPGFDPDLGDWFYAFQWASPPEAWRAKLGSNVDWQSPSEHLAYCSDCHDAYPRALGMPPKERREAW